MECDYVCTRCIKDFNLKYVMRPKACHPKKAKKKVLTVCDICDNNNGNCYYNNHSRWCFLLERSPKWHVYNKYHKSRFDDYYIKKDRSYEESDEYKQKMWKYGVEYEMGVMLCRIHISMQKGTNMDSLNIIPIEIIKIIYNLAKQIKQT